MADDILRKAWEEIYIAEGSDWFWWYGDDFYSEMDADFDAIFRTHLQSVYELLGDTAPDKLFVPIVSVPDRSRRLVERAPGTRIELDGRISSPAEWDHAMRYDTQYESPLAWETPSMIEAILMDCSDDTLALRCDLHAERPVDKEDSLLLMLHYPEKASINIPLNKGFHELFFGEGVIGASSNDTVLEVSIDLSSLRLADKQDITFNIKELRSGGVRAIHPAGELFRVQKPA